MAEIHPLVQEYHALQQLRGVISNLDAADVAAHIANFPIPGLTGAPGSGGTESGGEGGGPKAKRAGGAKRGRARSAPAGAPADRSGEGYDKEIVALVTAEPGLTAAQLAERLDLPVSVLFRTLPLLQRDGLVRKHGKGFSGA
ncbi:MAG: winged helix-turn-helix domain-containing protein [Patulibacter sp.]|nr:winged helix-turn-helix domain-containing protein [Patulibacter sp.]